jgi:lipoprotein LprG
VTDGPTGRLHDRLSAMTARTARPRTLAALVAPLLLAVAVLSGCGGSDKPEQSPEKTLAAAKKNLDSTSGVRIGLNAAKLPTGVNGLLAADGVGTHDPAFEGDIKVSATGITADAAVVALKGVVYAKLPFTSKFQEIDPGDYGAPDPADLMNTEGGLSSLLTSATDVEADGEVRDGKVVLTSYAATVPGKAVAAVIPSASATAEFDATFTVTDQDRLARAVLSGPFYPKADDVTYTITFDEYDTETDIKAP